MGTSPLAQTVRRRRLEMGLTKEEAARRARISLSTWHTVENADPDTAFREITLAGVASSLQLDVDAIFELAGMALPGEDYDAVANHRPERQDVRTSLERIQRGLPRLAPREAAAVAQLVDCLVDSRQREESDTSEDSGT